MHGPFGIAGFLPHDTRATPRRRGGSIQAAARILAVVALWLLLGVDGARALVISEVMYNPPGGDGGREWIELFNDSGADIDLSSYSLAWGGTDFTFGTLALPAVNLASGAYYVVGGPTSDGGNGNPTFDLAIDLAPNLQNPFLVTDGVALFESGVTNPIHVVLYGPLNLNGLIDESGAPGTPDVTWAIFGQPAPGSSLVFDGSAWSVSATPTPGTGGLVAVPEAGPAVLTLIGLCGLATAGTRRAAGS